VLLSLIEWAEVEVRRTMQDLPMLEVVISTWRMLESL